MLETVRQMLLREARNSSAMLQDMAGLERYVAESYSARSLIELLQNADDAGAEQVRFEIVNGFLLCANNGRVFTERDFLALCRSASSSKVRGMGIGYRGIGFKSVVGVANTVHLFSSTLECTFSRALTQSALAVDCDVPLVRVPHPLALSDEAARSRVAALKSAGFQTVFVFEGLELDKIRAELLQFDGGYMLFLQTVNSAVSVIEEEEVSNYRARRIRVEAGLMRTEILTSGGVERWILLARDEVTLAFSADERGPVPIRPDQGFIHAFLPTNEQCGFHMRLNADFSTDPSRTRVVLDHRTEELVKMSADVIAELISDIFESPDAALAGGMLEALTPSIDDLSLQLGRRTVASDLVTAVGNRLAHMSDTYVRPPLWMNARDAQELVPPDGKRLCPRVPGATDDCLDRINRLAGIGAVSADYIVTAVETGRMALTLEGYADLIAHVSGVVAPTGVTLEKAAAQTVDIDGEIVNARDLLSNISVAATKFQEILGMKGRDVDGLKRRLAVVGDLSSGGPGITGAEVGSQEAVPQMSIRTQALSPRGIVKTRSVEIPTSSNASAWRSAELIILELLAELGYEASDHSRQNLGYDILAVEPTGDKYVEVKSISYPGQPFSLTPNEDSFARDAGSSYFIALVYRATDTVYVQFVPNGRNLMPFIKQCRQWAWECSDYKFAPTHEIKLN